MFNINYCILLWCSQTDEMHALHNKHLERFQRAISERTQYAYHICYVNVEVDDSVVADQ